MGFESASSWVQFYFHVLISVFYLKAENVLSNFPQTFFTFQQLFPQAFCKDHFLTLIFHSKYGTCFLRLSLNN